MVAEAVDRLTEANAALRKRRKLAPLERDLETAMRRAFLAESRAFLARLALLRPYFPPAVREAEVPTGWAILCDEAAAATAEAFVAPIDAAASAGVEAGMAGAVLDLAPIATSFDLAHPRAADYLRERGALQVTRVRETTRETLRVILGQAADEGWSYQRTATAIRRRYRHFARERARNIAVFDLGDAYEAGNLLVARDLQDGGLSMEKQWLTVGDDKVRPEHRSNQGEGWIPLDQAFGSGHDRPPTDPRCRCTTLLRRKPDG